jgi:hypothetical protein
MFASKYCTSSPFVAPLTQQIPSANNGRFALRCRCLKIDLRTKFDKAPHIIYIINLCQTPELGAYDYMILNKQGGFGIMTVLGNTAILDESLSAVQRTELEQFSERHLVRQCMTPRGFQARIWKSGWRGMLIMQF